MQVTIRYMDPVKHTRGDIPLYVFGLYVAIYKYEGVFKIWRIRGCKLLRRFMVEDKSFSTIGRRLRYLRKKANISQQSLSEEFGLGYRTAISEYENGKRQIPIDIAKKYSEKFNVSTDWIIGITQYRNPDIKDDPEALELLRAYRQIILPEQRIIAIKQIKLLGVS